jgi:hypothetical protein
MHEKAEMGDIGYEAELGLREIAVAAGYRANRRTRCIERATLDRVAADLRALRGIEVQAAAQPASRADKQALIEREWVEPYLGQLQVWREGVGPKGTSVARTYAASPGEMWGETLFDRAYVAQVPAGILELDPAREGQAVEIAWYYLMRFRERRARTGNKQEIVRIRDLCAQAGIDPGNEKNRGRFLAGLDSWQARLRDLGVIGAYARIAPEGAGPAVVFARGSYVVERPAAIRRAYDAARDNARRDAAARRGAARARGRRQGRGKAGGGVGPAGGARRGEWPTRAAPPELVSDGPTRGPWRTAPVSVLLIS